MDLSVIGARVTRLAVTYLPPRRRGMRVAAFSEHLFGCPQEPVRVRHVTGYFVGCDLSDSVQKSLFYTGTFEPRTSALIAAALRTGCAFLDVGANVGHYTLVAARQVGGDGCVHAIEASSATAAHLTRTVHANRLESIVHVHHLAASDSAGTVTVLPGLGEHHIGTRFIDPSGASQLGLERVDAVRLDDLLPTFNPDVVKVDVEGADLRALVGMRRMIERARPELIVAEAEDALLGRFGDSTKDMREFMNALGYQAIEIHEPGHIGSIAFRT